MTRFWLSRWTREDDVWVRSIFYGGRFYDALITDVGTWATYAQDGERIEEHQAVNVLAAKMHATVALRRLAINGAPTPEPTYRRP